MADDVSWWQASEFARLLGSGGAAVDYIEEPLLDPLLLPLFSRQSGMRHALDESLYKHYIPSSRRSAPASGMPARERPASGLIDRPASEGGDGPAAGAHSPAALVLKPALMGGWEPCRTSIREAGPGVQVRSRPHLPQPLLPPADPALAIGTASCLPSPLSHVRFDPEYTLSLFERVAARGDSVR